MAAFGNLNIGIVDFRVGVSGVVQSAFVVDLMMGVAGLRPFETGMMVVADVKVKVEETGTRLTVVVPVVGCMQSDSRRTYRTHQQQAWAGRRQDSGYGSPESSHYAAPR
jgi:hypothetical protein